MCIRDSSFASQKTFVDTDKLVDELLAEMKASPLYWQQHPSREKGDTPGGPAQSGDYASDFLRYVAEIDERVAKNLGVIRREMEDEPTRSNKEQKEGNTDTPFWPPKDFDTVRVSLLDRIGMRTRSSDRRGVSSDSYRSFMSELQKRRRNEADKRREIFVPTRTNRLAKFDLILLPQLFSFIVSKAPLTGAKAFRLQNFLLFFFLTDEEDKAKAAAKRRNILSALLPVAPNPPKTEESPALEADTEASKSTAQGEEANGTTVDMLDEFLAWSRDHDFPVRTLRFKKGGESEQAHANFVSNMIRLGLAFAHRLQSPSQELPQGRLTPKGRLHAIRRMKRSCTGPSRVAQLLRGLEHKRILRETCSNGLCSQDMRSVCTNTYTSRVGLRLILMRSQSLGCTIQSSGTSQP
eukprot:TRINITY_DN9663_c0_g2_i2.p1 TRINITY_DN9663_c0_g2~~TRINITY_DN9663_c0_g2_i2.p1  ORF type:complete len:408 (-),score=76.14 TRINITY_DN9663_c0_g2_i2:589-1812(-)